ncbi:hypothetical protein A9Q83_05175 [Alphaproteobacteria bacterium 46_93_T64]|nr:hypothetical protein A9Q83_05175 [Alphaproteobacteria bacterium 46_93_T64]
MIHKTPTKAQIGYLKLGRLQAGGKLPLFDRNGQQISPVTIRSCIAKGWAQPWFENPIKKDWLVCRLTDEGRRVVEKVPSQK